MVSDAPKHYPVLLNEIISIITPQHGGTFIDCTFGQGGYTKKILSYKDTQVIAIDRDIESKKIADKIFKKFPNSSKHQHFSPKERTTIFSVKWCAAFSSFVCFGGPYGQVLGFNANM